ncbi:MAG: hypothetical protein HFE94_08300 [Acutalibacter sp.]|nr:hypothetical protein [Acutalibacter sp.]
MKSNKKIVYVLAAAIMLCMISAAGIYMFLAPQRATIYVFRNDCTAGTQVTRELLTPMEVDATIIEMGETNNIGKSYVTASEYTEILQNAGTLRYDVSAGTALMKSMLTSHGGSKVEMGMKPSSIAVTVPSDYLSAVTNELSSGAYVNVYASYDNNAQTLLILQNIRVLTAPRVDGVLAGVTLEVDHEQSLKLVHAMSYAKITFGLVNSQGYQYTVEEQPAYDIGGFVVDAETSGQTVVVPDPSAQPQPPAENGTETPPAESQPEGTSVPAESSASEAVGE